MSALEAYGAVLQSIFQCQQCGGCCKVCSHVSVDEKDIQNLSMYLNINEHDVIKKYTHRGLLSTKELNHDGACCFYDRSSKKCTVYEARPRVCRSYPLMSPEQTVYRNAGYAFKTYSDCPGCSQTLDFAKTEGILVDDGSSVAFNPLRIFEYLMIHPELLSKVKEQKELHNRERLQVAKLDKRAARIGDKNVMKQFQLAGRL